MTTPKERLPRSPTRRSAERDEFPMRLPEKDAWSLPLSTRERGNRAGSRRFPSLDGRLNIAHNTYNPFQASDEVFLRFIRRHQLSHWLSPLGNDQRFARRTHVFHECETARLEFSCRNLLHGQIVTYMVV